MPGHARTCQDMPGHDDEGVRDRDGGIPAARFAEPAVHTAELGTDAGAGAACRQAHSVRTMRTSALPLLARPDLCLPADSVLPGHNPDSRPVTQVGAGTRRVLSDLSWPNSADGRLQHRRKPGSPAFPSIIGRGSTTPDASRTSSPNWRSQQCTPSRRCGWQLRRNISPPKRSSVRTGRENTQGTQYRRLNTHRRAPGLNQPALHQAVSVA